MWMIPQEHPNHLVPAMWGLLPAREKQAEYKEYFKNPKTFGGLNAKSEKLFDHFIYRYSWKQRRCVIPIDGFFDYDEAYNHWSSLKTDGDLLEANPFKGQCKKVANKNSYAFLIPIPDKDEIKKQAIKDEATKETFKHESKVEMEHLFYSDATSEKFSVKNGVGGAEIIEISDSAKMTFAQEVIPELDAEHFEVLKPMFEFIKTKI